MLAVEFWCPVLAGDTPLGSAAGVAVALATLAAPLVAWSPTRSLGFAGLAVAEMAAISESFPWTGNHRYFELILCLLGAVLDGRVAEERRLFLRAVRWFTCVVLFYSGLQKLVHGFYFEGHYLAYMLHEETFRPILAPLLDPSEFERLASMPRQVGAGPYTVTSALFIAASNAVYLAEMSLAALLLVPRTRRVGVLGALLLLIAIELAARELFFGMVFANAVLTFWPRAIAPRAAVVFAALGFAALFIRAGWLGEVAFH